MRHVGDGRQRLRSEINASLGFEAPSRLVGFLAVGTPRATVAVERPSRTDHVVEWEGSSRAT